MSTLTQEQQQKITDWIAAHDLPSGLGTEESACSIAAINLALTGELTDDIPACMSLVIGRWIIRTQDAMPHSIRNSAEWKRLLPMAAGTGREHESARKVVVLDWLWSKVLPEIQHVADARGFGEAWRQMCGLKTAEGARHAAADAYAAYAYADAYADAAYAYAAADAAAAADAYAADAAYAYAAYAYAADAVADAAAAATPAAATRAATRAAARLQFWQNVDPCARLAELIAVSAG